MQNAIPMTTNNSISKPEVEFQLGGRPFSQNGSSNNSVVDWDILSKFGVLIDFYSPKLKPKLEVNFRPYGRYHEI